MAGCMSLFTLSMHGRPSVIAASRLLLFSPLSHTPCHKTAAAVVCLPSLTSRLFTSSHFASSAQLRAAPVRVSAAFPARRRSLSRCELHTSVLLRSASTLSSAQFSFGTAPWRSAPGSSAQAARCQQQSGQRCRSFSSSSFAFSSSASPSTSSFPRIIALGVAACSAFFLLGWYSQSTLTLHLHDAFPSLFPHLTSAGASRSLQPASFSTSYVDVLNYPMPTPVAVIAAINLAVFLLWRVPQLQPLMYRHFTTDYHRVVHLRQFHTLFTHAFSHQGGLHFLFNMVAIATISPQIAIFLSDSEYFAFYLTAAAVSSLVGFALTSVFSYRNNRAAQLLIPSLGASGAVFAIFAASSLCFPDNKYRILFIPYDIPASTLLPIAAAVDVVGLVYNMWRGSPLGHGAHLGGMLCGCLLYWLYLSKHPLLQRVQAERERRKMWEQRRQ